MKLGLIKSIPSKSGALISPRWYVNNCLSQTFGFISQRREKTGLGGLILHNDNTQAHRAWTTTALLAENAVLSTCDYFRFPKLTNQPRVIGFNSNDETLVAFDNVIGRLVKEDFQNCLMISFLECTNVLTQGENTLHK